MAFITTSRKFYDQFTGLSGGGVDTLNTCQGDLITCVIQGYFYWSLEKIALIFNASAQTITVYSQSETRSWLVQGFQVGDTIAISGTVSNNGNFTITALTDSVITVASGTVNETVGSPNASVFGTTPITSIDFFYNLISNTENVNYISKTDAGVIQKYTATGLLASATTPAYAEVGTDSYAWVNDVMTGNLTQLKIEGVAISGHQQQFKITQVFRQTRIWTKDLILNFTQRVAPIEFTNDNHLTHIFQVAGKFDYNNPVADHIGGLTNVKGFTAWYNQTSAQTRKEYSVTSIAYVDSTTSDVLPVIEPTLQTDVTINIYSRSGKFVTGTSKFLLALFQCPTNNYELQNTDTTLLQNINEDEVMITSDSAGINGINYGTDYQSITNAIVTFVNANNISLTFSVVYSIAIKNYLANKDTSDRLYAITVACQDISITTTKGVDRCNLIADFQNQTYDFRNKNLIGLVDYFHCFVYPNSGVFENSTVRGFQGDPVYIEIPFWIETVVINNISPTLQNVSVQVVSTKSGENDFILEEKVFDLSAIRKLQGKQTIDVETSRGFILEDNSPWNRANVVRYTAGDSGTKIAYLLQYAFVLRYESWIEAIQSQQGANIDIFKDIQNVTEAWQQYSIGFGWDLKLRFNPSAAGYDGFVTPFTAQTDIVIVTAAEDGQAFEVTNQYFNMDGVEVDFILQDEPTRVVCNYIGDPTIFPTGMTEYNGYAFVDDANGSIFSRRFASTDIASEGDSPFNIDTLPVLQNYVSQQSENNLRLTIFANRIVLDTVYTPIINDTIENKLIVFKLAYTPNDSILQENGSAIEQENIYNLIR